MELPRRFALSTLLLLMLVVASVFGYAQWRRQWLKSEVQRFKFENVEALEFSDHWFWPTTTKFALVTWTTNGQGDVFHEGVLETPEAASHRYETLAAEIRELGDIEVHPAIHTWQDSRVGTLNVVKTVSRVEELFDH